MTATPLANEPRAIVVESLSVIVAVLFVVATLIAGSTGFNNNVYKYSIGSGFNGIHGIHSSGTSDNGVRNHNSGIEVATLMVIMKVLLTMKANAIVVYYLLTTVTSKYFFLFSS